MCTQPCSHFLCLCRKLLEGEETRFRGFVDSYPSPAFPYRQPMTSKAKKEDKQADLNEELAAVAEELQAEEGEEEEGDEEEQGLWKKRWLPPSSLK